MTIEIIAKAIKVEVARAMEEYKNSADFEDKVNEVICDAYYKGFEECKRKVVQAFHLPNLNDIKADKPKEAEEGGAAGDQGEGPKSVRPPNPRLMSCPPWSSNKTLS